MFSLDAFKWCCGDAGISFTVRVMPCEWVPRGILMSEGFAFCAMCDLYRITSVIESGIYNGKSTLIWSKYFHTEMPRMDPVSKRTIVTAVDLVLREEALQRLKDRGVTLIRGDGNSQLPALVQAQPDERIALFIDGLKSHEAVDLAKKCFAFPQVIFAAFHDANKASTTRKYLEAWDQDKFYTDDEWFVERFKFLDKNESQLDVEQGLTWTPYKILPDRDLGGSYGMTMAFAFNKDT